MRGFIVALIIEEIVLLADVWELYTHVDHTNLMYVPHSMRYIQAYPPVKIIILADIWSNLMSIVVLHYAARVTWLYTSYTRCVMRTIILT